MTKTVTQKHAAMIEMLYGKTLNKSLEWELAEGRSPEIALGSYRVRLVNQGNEDDPLEQVSIFDAFGGFIESFTDEDIMSEKPKVRTFEAYWQMMQDLRQAAFRQAVGADRAIDDILDQLDDLL